MNLGFTVDSQRFTCIESQVTANRPSYMCTGLATAARPTLTSRYFGSMRQLHRLCGLAAGLALSVLVGCASQPESGPPPRPDEVRARIVSLMPASTRDRAGWAVDIYAAFAALRIEPTTSHLCEVLAVTAQESGFQVDPKVSGMAGIAWAEIDRRAERAGVPKALIHVALQLRSPNGKTYAERIDNASTERDLSDVFEDFVGTVPLGRRLFSGYNPVHTAGPMQVQISFAEAQVAAKPYPYPLDGTVRSEVFSRRGGLYFGIAHLLDYPANYHRPIFRFADFNAGRYASRNAAFQNAVSTVSGIPLATDGDLIRFDGNPEKPGATEVAVRSIGNQLDMSDSALRRALEQGEQADFERSRLYERVYELADRIERRPLPRAMVPMIELKSPKFTRRLTTEWFAKRVQSRYERCMAAPG